MSDEPRIADIVAQIAIRGEVDRHSARAPERWVVDRMVHLGFERANVADVLRHAIELGVIKKTGSDELTWEEPRK